MHNLSKPTTLQSAVAPLDGAGRRVIPILRFSMPTRTHLAVGWTLGLLLLLLAPSSWFSEGAPHFPYEDKVIHISLFAGFGLLWMRAGTSSSCYLWVIAAGLSLAIGTELAQGLPFISRDPGVLDAVADAIGLTLGLVLASIRLPFRGRRSASHSTAN
jgi:hypothetical protein